MSLSTWVNACAIGGVVILVAALHVPDTVTAPPAPIVPVVLADSMWSDNVAKASQQCVMDAMVIGKDDEEIEAVFGYCLFINGVTI